MWKLVWNSSKVEREEIFSKEETNSETVVQ